MKEKYDEISELLCDLGDEYPEIDDELEEVGEACSLAEMYVDVYSEAIELINGLRCRHSYIGKYCDEMRYLLDNRRRVR